jgi:hypothetical protein
MLVFLQIHSKAISSVYFPFINLIPAQPGIQLISEYYMVTLQTIPQILISGHLYSNDHIIALQISLPQIEHIIFLQNDNVVPQNSRPFLLDLFLFQVPHFKLLSQKSSLPKIHLNLFICISLVTT